MITKRDFNRIRERAVLLEELKEKGNTCARIVTASGINRDVGYFLLGEMCKEELVTFKPVGQRGNWVSITKNGVEWLKMFHGFTNGVGKKDES